MSDSRFDKVSGVVPNLVGTDSRCTENLDPFNPMYWELERQVQESQPRLKESEWLKLFLPEIRQTIKDMILDRRIRFNALRLKVQRAMSKFKDDQSNSDENKWLIWKLTWGLWAVPELEKLKKELKRLDHLIYLSSDNRIDRKTSWEVKLQRAKGVSILDVVDSVAKIRRVGSRYRTNCPLHNDKTPSFYADPDKNYFICFGCQQKGDVIKFVQLFYGLSFKEAVEFLNKF